MKAKNKLLPHIGIALSWLCALLPVLLCLLVHGALALSFRYLRYDAELLGVDVAATLIALAPTIVFVICWLTRFRRGRGNALRGFLAVVCALYLPVSFFAQMFVAFLCPWYSETASPAHYMQLDDHGAYESALMYELFPEEAPDSLTDYYYRHVECVDWNYEVYAACTLTPVELESERQRITALYDGKNGYWTVETAQRGDFTCLMCYGEQHPFSLAGSNQYYTHAIFAFDEATGRVRYIFNSGVDVPENFLPRCFALAW